jgi:hypothetical protein
MNLQSAPGHAVATRFGQEFVKKNGAPNRVVLEGLRQNMSCASFSRQATVVALLIATALPELAAPGPVTCQALSGAESADILRQR